MLEKKCINHYSVSPYVDSFNESEKKTHIDKALIVTTIELDNDTQSVYMLPI